MSAVFFAACLVVSLLTAVPQSHASDQGSFGDRVTGNAASAPHPETGTNGWDSTQDSNVCTASDVTKFSCSSLMRRFYLHGNEVSLDNWYNKVSAQTPGVTPMLPGFTAPQLRSAYSLSGSGDGSRVIALVDAYYYPTALNDLNSYRSHYGSNSTPLRSCDLTANNQPTFPTSGQGCFAQINQNGVSANFPASNVGWNQEEALDLDMATGLCPDCSIVLVAANSASFPDLNVAVGAASQLRGIVAISNSYGSAVDISESSMFGASVDNYLKASNRGIAVTASSGDNGYGVGAPASFSSVVGVGGTSLTLNPNGSRATETTWSGAGSGCSQLNMKPSWQNVSNSICSGKVISDVSAVANPSTGVLVIYNGSSYIFGGTSVSSPIIAAAFALAGSTGSGVNIQAASRLWSLPSGFYDVTFGSNGSCAISALCNSAVGWDGPTGLGALNGLAPFAQVPAQPPTSQAPLLITNVNTSNPVGTQVSITWSGGSGIGAVSFNVIGSNCALNQNVLTASLSASCSVTVTKAASTGYLASTSNPTVFTFAQVAQTITFTAPTSLPLIPATYTLTATSSSGLTPAIASTTPAICTVSGLLLTLVTAGTCTLTASQAGNNIYGPAPVITRSISLVKATILRSVNSTP